MCRGLKELGYVKVKITSKAAERNEAQRQACRSALSLHGILARNCVFIDEVHTVSR